MDVKEIGLNSLKPWEENPRVNDHAVDAVAKSIERFGFNVPILCDQNSMIIAGHTRWKAAKKLGLSQVSVIQIEMTDSQRKAFSIADNKTAQIADWDFPKLREIFDELRTEDINLNDLGFSDADLRRMLFNIDIDENEVPKIGEVSRAEFGQVYALDVHRLICGLSLIHI